MREPLPGPTKAAARRILLVNDDHAAARWLGDFLRSNGYTITWTERPATVQALLAEGPELILLHARLPERNGFDLCVDLRRGGVRTPIILLDVDAGDQGCIRGLRAGADDYLGEPFNPLVLLARIEAVLRRADIEREEQPRPKLRLDEARKTLARGEVEIALTLSEYQLLSVLMGAPGRCFRRGELRAVLGGGDPTASSDRAIDIHVSRLRNKLEDDPHNPRHLVTLRGAGYRFDW